MSKKKIIVYLSILLVLCTVSTKHVLSSSFESRKSNSSISPGSSNYISNTTNLNEPSKQNTDPPTTVTVDPETIASTEAPTESPTVTKAPSTTNPITTTKPATTAKPTTTTQPTTTANPTTTTPIKPSNIVLDNLIGKSKDSVTGQFGNPVAIEKSEYGFDWYVYHENYANFIMIGIQSNKVVGLYSNCATLSFENIIVGATRKAVRESLGGRYSGPLTSILKGNTEYLLPKPELWDVFTDGQKYVTVFYDNVNGGILTSVQIIDYSTEQSFGLFPAPSKEFIGSYERISFYLINSTRVNFKKPILQYDNNMAKVAAAHSQDMIDRSFFGHTNPDGLDPGIRIKAAGYNYRHCAENIAKNLPGAIYAHESYMNSPDHRKNILGVDTCVGIGVRMAKGCILQTENYITY